MDYYMKVKLKYLLEKLTIFPSKSVKMSYCQYQRSRLIKALLVSADVKFKFLNTLATIALMDSFISVHKYWVPKVLGPGGDVSTSEGEGDLGAAHVSSRRSGPTLETDGKENPWN